MKTFVRLTKIVEVEVEAGESTEDAVQRADILDSDGALEFSLITQIVDEQGEILEEI